MAYVGAPPEFGRATNTQSAARPYWNDALSKGGATACVAGSDAIQSDHIGLRPTTWLETPRTLFADVAGCRGCMLPAAG